jgi:hypothetical protein
MTSRLFAVLRRSPAAAGPDDVVGPPQGAGSPFHDEDLQLALHVCYELHYQGFDDVDDGWEWRPGLLDVRGVLERRFEAGLAEAVPRPAVVPPREVPGVLARLVAADDGPSLAEYLQRHGTMESFREFAAHRSVYHLREADPHTWAIPRLRGRPKAALVEIQADEYGGGRPERVHAELFRATLRGLGLDDSYGAHLGRVPAVTLAVNNLMSLFGLHRRWRGALLGHLAAFEMTSSLPSRRYAAGLRRIGASPGTCLFYDEHVQADAVHEQVAAHDLCGSFAAQHPELVGDVLFGAACALTLDRLFAGHVLSRWRRGESSLRPAARALEPA